MNEVELIKVVDIFFAEPSQKFARVPNPRNVHAWISPPYNLRVFGKRYGNQKYEHG